MQVLLFLLLLGFLGVLLYRLVEAGLPIQCVFLAVVKEEFLSLFHIRLREEDQQLSIQSLDVLHHTIAYLVSHMVDEPGRGAKSC